MMPLDCQCSTPFGITDRITSCAGGGDAVSNSAQRLSASLIGSQTLQMHQIYDKNYCAQRLSASLIGSLKCSSSIGISIKCAQRLSASLIGSLPILSTYSCSYSFVLNAFRHH